MDFTWVVTRLIRGEVSSVIVNLQTCMHCADWSYRNRVSLYKALS